MKDRSYNINNRPTMQFLKLAEEFIAFAKATLQDKKIKGLSSVQAELDSLERTLLDPKSNTGLKLSWDQYEQDRTDSLGNTETLDQEYDKAVREKKRADDIYNKLPAQHDRDVAKQKELRNATVESIYKEQLDAIGKIAEETEKHIQEDTERAQHLATKRAELNKLYAKIQSNCCGGRLCNKKDLAKAKNVEFEIRVLEGQQELLRDRPKTLTGKEAKIRELEKKLENEKKKINELIDSYEDRRKAAQARVSDAAKALTDIAKKMDEEILDQCRIISRDTMFDAVHLRARISHFYRVVEEVYQNNTATKPVLDVLISARNNWRKRLNDAIACLYYPALDGQTGLQFYSKYCDWAMSHPAEQKAIESAEYSPNEHIDHLVPESTLLDTKHVRAKTLGSIHDFFPTEARAKRKSIEMKEVAPGLKASSSSSTL